MKKKLIGLSTLLLVLLLGLSTTSYAKTLTENEIRNFCENAYKQFINSEIPDNVHNTIEQTDFSSWSQATEDYER